jgi:hypothetical protein
MNVLSKSTWSPVALVSTVLVGGAIAATALSTAPQWSRKAGNGGKVIESRTGDWSLVMWG